MLLLFFVINYYLLYCTNWKHMLEGMDMDMNEYKKKCVVKQSKAKHECARDSGQGRNYAVVLALLLLKSCSISSVKA